tara:strand:- start:7727 stop:8191 length:465 start_codon:yes stop_codon:yes gene_type:complete
MDKDYIERIIKKDITSLGHEIWGIEIVGSRNNRILRVFIDNKTGVNIEDCEKVSKQINRVIESDQLCTTNMSLEVSSPGLERKFFNKEQFPDYLGFSIRVTYKSKENEKITINGLLVEVDEERLILEKSKEDLYINFKDIVKANLVYIGEENAK